MKLLRQLLEDHGAPSTINCVTRGAAVTRYEVYPHAGVKVSKIQNLAVDIALNMSASSVRIEAPITGKRAIGIELPNFRRDTVSLHSVLDFPAFTASESDLAFGVGMNIDRHPVICDIANMPHLLVAGEIASGKSVCMNSIIMSILGHADPDNVKLILIDTKIVEFQIAYFPLV